MKCVQYETAAAVHQYVVSAVRYSPQYSVYTNSCYCTSVHCQCCKIQSTVQCVCKQKQNNKDGHITFNIILLFARYGVQYLILYLRFFWDLKLISVSSYKFNRNIPFNTTTHVKHYIHNNKIIKSKFYFYNLNTTINKQRTNFTIYQCMCNLIINKTNAIYNNFIRIRAHSYLTCSFSFYNLYILNTAISLYYQLSWRQLTTIE